MLILGIGGWLHDGAAALMRDGRLVAAVEEEKLARQSHRAGLPQRAISSCLAMASASAADVGIVALARPLATGSDSSFHIHLKSVFPNARMVIIDHHDAHAASAFFASPHESARVVTLDRHGDMRCGAVWEGNGSQLDAIEELYSPDSPAALYSRVTELAGFAAGGEEHKLQWLALLGEAKYAGLFTEILGGEAATLPRLNQSYFDTARPTQGGFSEKFYREVGIEPGAEVDEQVQRDLAASVQTAVADCVARVAGEADHLCLAGGLAMNTLLVEALETGGKFGDVFVQPAAGNAGTAIGSAYHAWHKVLKRTERVPMENLFLGPSFESEEIKQVLENCKLRMRYLMTDTEVIAMAVQRLADNQILAWFQGRTEFGPRALGNRSILASPLNPYSTENLNVYIKRREQFRKFAASVPEESADEYFETSAAARHLATVSRVKPAHKKTFEAALLDGERIRVHVVRKSDNRLYWELLQQAGSVSGLPVLYNTSFNLFGEPLVNGPRAALRSFYSSGIDSMFVGRFLLEK